MRWEEPQGGPRKYVWGGVHDYKNLIIIWALFIGLFLLRGHRFSQVGNAIHSCFQARRGSTFLLKCEWRPTAVFRPLRGSTFLLKWEKRSTAVFKPEKSPQLRERRSTVVLQIRKMVHGHKKKKKKDLRTTVVKEKDQIKAAVNYVV